MIRMIVPLALGLGLFLSSGTARAEHKQLHEAIVELEKAREHLSGEKKHEDVEKAYRAVKEALVFAKETKGTFGGRRERLIERLTVLDRELEKNWVDSKKAIDEAIEDLKFAETRD